jgi:hypothetical protein
MEQFRIVVPALDRSGIGTRQSFPWETVGQKMPRSLRGLKNACKENGQLFNSFELSYIQDGILFDESYLKILLD